MDTTHDRLISRADRLPAQMFVTAGLVCAAIAFLVGSGLPSFLFALGGVILTLIGACLTPDGWLVDPEEAE